ncbi:hypothetical protein Tco_0757376 [Tanacetum coccineum]
MIILPFSLPHLHCYFLPLWDSTMLSSSKPSNRDRTYPNSKETLCGLNQEDDDTPSPSPLAKSSSPSLPNAPSKTPSTKETSSTFGTTLSSFESKPHSSPLFSRNTHSPQPTNPFLHDPLDAPPRPSNPLLL